VPHAVPAEQPFVLVEAGAHGIAITAVNAPARRQGITPGLALADARAAWPGLLTRASEPARDRAQLAAIAGWAGRYGPLRNVDGGDGLWIEATGVAHLYGGEDAMLADLVGRLARAGFAARAGIADTLGAAHALARFAAGSAESRIASAPAGATAAALAGLPVAALRLDPDAVLLLERLGLRRIGQLYDLPRAALAQRFRAAARGRRAATAGERLAGAVLARLDEALGRSAEPRRPLAEPPPHAVRRLFAEPLISADGLAAALRVLAGELCAGLAARAEGARRFELALYRADGTWAAVEAGTSAPCRDAAHLVRLLGEKLAAIDAGLGVDALVLAAGEVEPMAPAEPPLTAADRGPPADPSALIDRLTSRLGAGRVLALAPVASHLPERAQRLVPALRRGHPLAIPPPAAKPARPAFLLAAPEPISVVAEVPEGPPARFTWRRVLHRIVRTEGPERIAPEWWRELAAPAPTRPRDYYRIEDDCGARFWVFRDGLYQSEAEHGPPRWFVHGLYG